MDGGTTTIEVSETFRILAWWARQLLPIVPYRRKTNAFKRLPWSFENTPIQGIKTKNWRHM